MAVVLRQGSATAKSITFRASCLVTDEVGNLVHISGPKVGPLYTVSSIDISDADSMPAVGIIVDKPTSITCVVQMQGPTTISSGIETLPPGKRCFAGYDSKPTTTAPDVSRSPNGKMILQVVGVALDSDKIEIMPDMSIIHFAV